MWQDKQKTLQRIGINDSKNSKKAFDKVYLI